MKGSRITYLEEISEFTGRPLKILLKKEARHWLETILSRTRIVGGHERYVIFGEIEKANKYKYFTYTYAYSHVHFNDSYSLPGNRDMYDMLTYTFQLSETDIDTMLRSTIKKFLIKNDIIPLRKLKFFFKGEKC